VKQVLQSLKTGEVQVAEVPAPVVRPGQLLIRTDVSLISAGTERMLMEFGKAGWIEKARRQPERVRQVLDKARTDGLWETIEAVRTRLDQPLPLGYCNVGRVIAVGEGVSGFAVGDWVVSNGWHAEVVAVPALLCAKVPEAVPDEAAAFTVLGAIALQGVRLIQPTLGERVAVIGLGLVGLDMVPDRLALARRFGAEVVDLAAGGDALAAAEAFSHGRGVDAVLIAAATQSHEPIRQAAQMCRQRGRIVLVGVAGLELSRDEFYKKELTFQVSCAYGPGRYDPNYEEKGQDYPFGLVRWTAQRNFEAVLELLAEGRLEVAPLITHRVPIEDAERAYALLEQDRQGLGILLTYARAATATPPETPPRIVRLPTPDRGEGAVSVAVLGAGVHAQRALLPALRGADVRLRAVVSANGVGAAHAGCRLGIELASTDPEAAISDPEVNAVVIATRHDSHARYVLAAFEAGKHVFVEKPLCLTLEELEAIERAWQERAAKETSTLLMVGFNRRFSPFVRRMKRLLEAIPGPRTCVVTVNAGPLPPEHWVLDPVQGGGRLLAEGCHFVDLIRFLVGHPIAEAGVTAARGSASPDHDFTVSLRFVDGSVGVLHYLTSGHRQFPKERIEVFGGGRVLKLDNFRRLRPMGWPPGSGLWRWRQDKGHRACVQAFVSAVRDGGSPPIPPDELFEVARVTIELAQQRHAS
jgi:predicted dehydrogenase